MFRKTILFKVFFVGCLLTLFFLSHLYAATSQALDFRTSAYKAQQRGDVQQAIDLYQRAIAADPSYATPHNDLGVVYEMVGQEAAAEREYLKALQVNPNYAGVYSNLALLYEKKGDMQRAIAYWDKRANMGASGDQWAQKARENSARLKSYSMAVSVPQATPYVPMAASSDYERMRATQVAQMFVDEKESSRYGAPRGHAVPSSSKNPKKYVNKLVSKAGNALYAERFQDAIDTLFEAKHLRNDGG